MNAEKTPPTAAGNRRNERLALMALAGMALVWGYNWVVMKQVLAYVGPFEFSALRTLFGAAALLLVLKFLRRPMRSGPGPAWCCWACCRPGCFPP